MAADTFWGRGFEGIPGQAVRCFPFFPISAGVHAEHYSKDSETSLWGVLGLRTVEGSRKSSETARVPQDTGKFQAYMQLNEVFSLFLPCFAAQC